MQDLTPPYCRDVVKRDASLVTEAQRAAKLRDLTVSIAKADKASFDARKEIFENVKKRIERFAGAAYSGSTAFRNWVDGLNSRFEIPAFENNPDEITSNRVLHMAALSTSLIRIGEQGKGQFYIEGIHDGQNAGYFFGLKRDIIARIAASNTRLSEKGVVNVGDKPEPLKLHPDAGKRCDARSGRLDPNGAGVFNGVSMKCDLLY